MALAIMVQGTASNVGKSVVVCGLCRAFARRGFSVAPFKSQNMALNSFVTREGLEMGRAQVSQAYASYKEPHVLMNPVLLKPTTDVGSQVIVKGRPVGMMSAREYQGYKRTLLPQVIEAYGQLAAENDIVVIEGAGSPAEINLRADDIVNMGLAEALDVPVILVADIDRGGVFASILGTLELLEPHERSRVIGSVINKFRGDVSLLEPGIVQIEKRARTSILGVVPYVELDLDDEDSLSEKLVARKAPQDPALIDIAVLKLGKLSNFSDFTAFGRYENVCLRYVTRPEEIEGVSRPDALIIPGSKNTIIDLQHLRARGFEPAIRSYVEAKGALVGVCGGFQMLGQEIKDPQEVESFGVQTTGLGYLPLATTLRKRKTLRQFAEVTPLLPGALEPLSCCVVSGYEIHHGETRLVDQDARAACAQPLVSLFAKPARRNDATLVGAGLANARIFGMYVHGLFDSTEFMRAFLAWCAPHKTPKIKEGIAGTYEEYVDEQLNSLAITIERSLDLDDLLKRMRAWGERP